MGGKKSSDSRKLRRKIAKEIHGKPGSRAGLSQSTSAALPTPAIDIDADALWGNVIKAAGAQPKEAKTIRGASGILHPMTAVGVDEERRRLLIVSAEPDPRSAAMAQADIQSAHKNLHVITARPIALNLAKVSQALTEAIGQTTLGPKEFDRFNTQQEWFGEILKSSLPAGAGIAAAFPNFLPFAIQFLQQLSFLSLNNEDVKFSAGEFAIGLEKLNEMDPTDKDRQFGVCPFPIYDFTEQELNQLQSTSELEQVKEILLRHDVLQYFFPAPDQLALGLIDRGVGEQAQIVEQIQQLPELGHPLGSTEIMSGARSIPDVIDALRERNLIAEGELTYEITPEGEAIRQTVKFKPKEGLLSKLINRFEFKIDLKDLFRGGGT